MLMCHRRREEFYINGASNLQIKPQVQATSSGSKE